MKPSWLVRGTVLLLTLSRPLLP